MRSLLFIVIAVSLGLSIPAMAGRTAEEAEVLRLITEMNKFAARNAWSGASRTYNSLLLVPGAEIDMETHLLGVQAAKSDGDVVATWRRVKHILTLAPLNEDLIMQMAQLEANYGPVNLKMHNRFDGDPTLKGQDLGFNPEYSAVFEYAKDAILKQGVYVGPLPLGRYDLGHEHFEIIGGPEVVLLVKRQK